MSGPVGHRQDHGHHPGLARRQHLRADRFDRPRSVSSRVMPRRLAPAVRSRSKPSACRSSRLARAGARRQRARPRGRGLGRRTRRAAAAASTPGSTSRPTTASASPERSPATAGGTGTDVRGDRPGRSPRVALERHHAAPSCGRGRRAMAAAPSAPGPCARRVARPRRRPRAGPRGSGGAQPRAPLIVSVMGQPQARQPRNSEHRSRGTNFRQRVYPSEPSCGRSERGSKTQPFPAGRPRPLHRTHPRRCARPGTRDRKSRPTHILRLARGQHLRLLLPPPPRRPPAAAGSRARGLASAFARAGADHPFPVARRLPSRP